MKERNLTTDPLWCVQVKAEKSSALPLLICRSACFSLWGRGRFAVPAKGCSHLSFSQQAASEGIYQALPRLPALDRHSRKRRMKPGSILGPLAQVFSAADPGATRTPKSRAATDCWRVDKVGWEPAMLGSELLSHAAANMWCLFLCLLLAGLRPYSANFSGKCDE